MPVGGRSLRLSVALLCLAVAACGSDDRTSDPTSAPPGSSEGTTTSAVPPTTTAAPTTAAPTTATPTTAAPTTAEPALRDLEVVEWAEYPYPTGVNADTHAEIMVRNPNDVPLRIDQNQIEVRFVNAAGDVVYANPNPFLYIWQGEWVKAGETFPIAACACFETSGLARQEWATIELSAAITDATGVKYTDNVQFVLGEWFRLSDRHLGGDSLGADFTLANTGDQVLSGFEVRVTARDANGTFVGVAVWGTFGDRNNPNIAPGLSTSGVLPTMIDWYDGPMTYTSEALGIPQG